METAPTYDENEMLRLFKEGNEQAVTQLYRTYFKPLVFFCFQIVREKLQAEDVTQEAFLKLWKNRTNFNSPAELRSYLYVTAKNTALNILNHNEVIARHQQHVGNQVSDQTAYIENRMLYAELMTSIYEEIRQLPPIYAEVLQLFYLEEMPPAEIAQQLQLTPENLRIRKFRAISMLKSELLKKGLSATALIFYYILVTKG